MNRTSALRSSPISVLPEVACGATRQRAERRRSRSQGMCLLGFLIPMTTVVALLGSVPLMLGTDRVGTSAAAQLCDWRRLAHLAAGGSFHNIDPAKLAFYLSAH